MTPQQLNAMKLALEALTYIYTETTADEDELIDQAITAIKEALAQPEQKPTDIAALVQGMEVSIDVSTGDHDAQRRLFGTVTLVQQNQRSRHGLILLVQDPQPNFKAQRKPLTDGEIYAMCDDFHNWSEWDGGEYQRLWLNLCRATEAAHDIKEKK